MIKFFLVKFCRVTYIARPFCILNLNAMSNVHILPVNDDKDHTTTADCPCSPIEQIDPVTGEPTYYHRSFDGRNLLQSIFNFQVKEQELSGDDKASQLNNVAGYIELLAALLRDGTIKRGDFLSRLKVFTAWLDLIWPPEEKIIKEGHGSPLSDDYVDPEQRAD